MVFNSLLPRFSLLRTVPIGRCNRVEISSYSKPFKSRSNNTSRFVFDSLCRQPCNWPASSLRSASLDGPGWLSLASSTYSEDMILLHLPHEAIALRAMVFSHVEKLLEPLNSSFAHFEGKLSSFRNVIRCGWQCREGVIVRRLTGRRARQPARLRNSIIWARRFFATPVTEPCV